MAHAPECSGAVYGCPYCDIAPTTIARIQHHSCPMRELVRQTVNAIKVEVMNDIITGGRIPATVGSFSELHNYCDANCLGGMCDDDGPWAEQWSDDIEPDERVQQNWINAVNDVQDAVDHWIKNGGLAAELVGRL